MTLSNAISESFKDKYFIAFAGFLIIFLGMYPFLYQWFAVPTIQGQCKDFLDKAQAGRLLITPDNCTSPTIYCFNPTFETNLTVLGARWGLNKT